MCGGAVSVRAELYQGSADLAGCLDARLQPPSPTGFFRFGVCVTGLYSISHGIRGWVCRKHQGLQLEHLSDETQQGAGGPPSRRAWRVCLEDRGEDLEVGMQVRGYSSIPPRVQKIWNPRWRVPRILESFSGGARGSRSQTRSCQTQSRVCIRHKLDPKPTEVRPPHTTRDCVVCRMRVV